MYISREREREREIVIDRLPQGARLEARGAVPAEPGEAGGRPPAVRRSERDEWGRH